MSLKKFPIMVGLLLALASVCHAAKVETRNIPSKAMKKEYPANIITPDSYNKSDNANKKTYPVLYLLHGFSGSNRDWSTFTNVAKLADQYNMIIVCPDGAFDSWYFDVPNDPTHQFETYITREVVGFIDANYRTIKTPAGRAITGLSMGGHGGLYLGFRHPEIYGGCGSTSGGVDLRPYPDN